METKEIKIDIPEGYEIDKDNSTFERIVFKPIKKKLPETWKEFCSTYPITQEDYYIGQTSSTIFCCNEGERNFINHKNLIHYRKTAEAFLALMQLIQLRDCYNDGWVPDWTDDTTKYSIFVYNNKLDRCCSIQAQRTLAFKTLKLRDDFLDNFKDLLEIAKPLL